MAAPATGHLVGFHCSAAKGIWNAVLNAKCCGATSFAFFTRSSRTWTAPALAPADAIKFKQLCVEHGFDASSIMPHGTYLSNAATSAVDVRKKSIDGIIDEAVRCHALGITLYNFHPGSRPKGGDMREALANVAAAINDLHTRVPTVVMVIETMAGQGGQVGASFEEIAEIIAGVTDKSRVGVCIDTAHVHGAGYDIRTQAGWDAMMASFDAIVGLRYLRGVHVNDSKVELGSRVDRHAPIGRGKIGIEAFRTLMNDSRLRGMPLILETPTPEEKWKEFYTAEIALLHSLTGTKAGDPIVLPAATAVTDASPKPKMPKKKAKAADDAGDEHDSAEDDADVSEPGAAAAAGGATQVAGKRKARAAPRAPAAASTSAAGDSQAAEAGKAPTKKPRAAAKTNKI